jgi:hypothetical protein
VDVKEVEEVEEVKEQKLANDDICFRFWLLILYFIYLLDLLYLIFKMRRVFLGGLALLFCGVIAAREKAEPLVFVFIRVDREKDIAVLRPMIAPDIGVQLDSGPRNLERGTLLRCTSFVREHSAIVEGQLAQVTDLLLDCGGRKFVVKTLGFTPERK